MKNRNRFIMGSAIGLAALAAAIDHTRHRLPEPAKVSQPYYDEEEDSPCSMDSPCAFDESPCSMDSPCAMDDSPCSLDDAPCSL